ncbi:MAG: hypothetical protein PCFJNLEI_03903 [Verrucomicrobiae bacterium]|nr:hypothetical protein [Verrucomicrobiae bacterium]
MKPGTFVKVVTWLFVVLGGLVFGIFLSSWLMIRSHSSSARPILAKRQIDAYQLALKLLVTHTGVPPSPAQGLDALISPSGMTNWQGPYLDPPVFRTDPWAHPYRYRLTGTNTLVDSAGPDGMFDTADDIRSR